MKNLYLFLLCFVSIASAQSQEKLTINGYLRDASNGETLIGANVFVKELVTGSTSNEYGFYSISIPPGDYTLEYSYLGYQTATKSITLSENVTIDIDFVAEGIQIEEIVIKGEAENANVSETEMSTNYDPKDADALRRGGSLTKHSVAAWCKFSRRRSFRV